MSFRGDLSNPSDTIAGVWVKGGAWSNVCGSGLSTLAGMGGGEESLATVGVSIGVRSIVLEGERGSGPLVEDGTTTGLV